MFFGLVKKELKYQLKSLIPYLLLLIIFSFYISQYGFIDSDDINSLKPTTEIQYIYNYLETVKDTGTIGKYDGFQIDLTNSQLTEVNNSLMLLDSISTKDDYDNLVTDSEKEFMTILDKLNATLGGETILWQGSRASFLAQALNYGTKEMLSENKKMLSVINRLISDYKGDSIYTYPLGFVKRVVLNDSRKLAMKETLNAVINNGDYYINHSKELNSAKIKCSFIEFEKLMNNLNKKLGGGSSYSSTHRTQFYQEKKSYSEAKVSYESIKNEDRYSNAFARYYSDYMGITAALFPIFIAAFVLTRDKRSKMQELINSKKVKSFVYILAKYTAIVILLFIIYMLVAGIASYQFNKIASLNNLVIDKLAFFTHTLYWIMPTIMFVVATSMLLAMVFKRGVIVIPVQFLLCTLSLLPLYGDYRLSKFVIRCNTIVGFNDFKTYSSQLTSNRVFYVLLSLALIFITSLLFNKNRSHNNGKHKLFNKHNKI